MIEQFSLTISRLSLFKRNLPLVAACSGGLDSMALCLLCKFEKLNFKALIVDHKFRENSQADALKASQVLKSLDIHCEILENNKISPTSDIENNLRKVRYDLIFDYMTKHKINQLFTAHHFNDQIETFLMRIEKGSGLEGLTSIKKESVIEGKKVFRPLLDVKKDDLKKYLNEQNIEWVEDESNIDEKFKRNKLRKLLSEISEKDNFNKRVSQSIVSIKRSNNFIEEYLIKILPHVLEFNPIGFFAIKSLNYSKEHEEIRLRIIKFICNSFTSVNKDLRGNKIKNIDDFLLNHSKKSFTAFGLKFLNDNTQFLVFRELEKIPDLEIRNSEHKVSLEWDNYSITFENDLKNAEGLIISALGKKSFKNIKKNIENSQINREIIATLPCLKKIDWYDNKKVEKILCVPHIKYKCNESKSFSAEFISTNMIEDFFN